MHKETIIDKIISDLMVVIESWILGSTDDSIGGILNFSLNEGRSLKFFIKIKRETRRTGEKVIGTLFIELTYKLSVKENGEILHSEKKIGKFLINLRAYIRSAMRITEHTGFMRMLGSPPISGEFERTIPIQFIHELEDRLTHIKENIKDILVRDLQEKVQTDNLSLTKIDLRITSKKSTSNPVDIFFKIVRYLIQQYIDVSQAKHISRELIRRYGTDVESMKMFFDTKWERGFIFSLRLLSHYFDILTRSGQLSPKVFAEALARNLGAKAAKQAFQKFWHLLSTHATSDPAINELRKKIRGLLAETTLYGVIQLEDYYEQIGLSELESKEFSYIENLIKPGLSSFLKKIDDIKRVVSKQALSREEFLVLVSRILHRRDLSDDDKAAALLILTLLYDSSLLKRTLMLIRSHSLCERCVGFRLVHILLSMRTRALRSFLKKLNDIIYLLIYSNELREGTYALILTLAYVIKASVLTLLGDEERAKKTRRTALKLAYKLNIPEDILHRLCKVIQRV